MTRGVTRCLASSNGKLTLRHYAVHCGYLRNITHVASGGAQRRNRTAPQRNATGMNESQEVVRDAPSSGHAVTVWQVALAQ